VFTAVFINNRSTVRLTSEALVKRPIAARLSG
jgi:hypothetical protein